MKIRMASGLGLLLLIGAGSACSSSTPAQPTTAPTVTTPATTPSPSVVIGAPTPVTPSNGATTSGYPTLTVADAGRTGPAGALVYRFDIAASSTFGTILLSGTVSETPGQTSFTPPAATPPLAQSPVFWRAVAIDPVNLVASPASAVQSFTYTTPPSQAAQLAAQLGVPLWPGAQPPGNSGHATMGDGWGIGNPISYTGVVFVSPQIDQLQVFDLLDRGLDPQSAIDWMLSHGYPTIAAYYPAVSVIGFQYSYLALINAQWVVVIKAGA